MYTVLPLGMSYMPTMFPAVPDPKTPWSGMAVKNSCLFERCAGAKLAGPLHRYSIYPSESWRKTLQLRKGLVSPCQAFSLALIRASDVSGLLQVVLNTVA